jgi:hypothetical protein
MTQHADRHVWVKEYRSNQDVYDAVMGSCHLPVPLLPLFALPHLLCALTHLICIGAVVGCGQIYCAPNRTVHGRHVVDGAFSVRGEDLPHGDQVHFATEQMTIDSAPPD